MAILTPIHEYKVWPCRRVYGPDAERRRRAHAPRVIGRLLARTEVRGGTHRGDGDPARPRRTSDALRAIARSAPRGVVRICGRRASLARLVLRGVEGGTVCNGTT